MNWQQSTKFGLKRRRYHWGLDLRRFNSHQVDRDPMQSPLILWNHRWEADKNPELFFAALYRLADEGIAFRVALAGENFQKEPVAFEAARRLLGERVVHYGYAADLAEYARLLWTADYVVSTANQDFFGHCDCRGAVLWLYPAAALSFELSSVDP